MNPLPSQTPSSQKSTAHSEHPFGGLGPRHGEHYLDATVQTASPARLRLMLIERAVEVAKSLAEIWRPHAGKPGANEQSFKLFEILNELLGGVTADSGEVGQKVADLYVFLIQHLIAAEETSDAGALDEISLVLQTEAETWRMVCAGQSPSTNSSGNAAPPPAGGLNLHA